MPRKEQCYVLFAAGPDRILVHCRKKQMAGRLESWSTPLLLVAPVAFLVSFFVESPAGVDARNVKLIGCIMVLAACVFLTAAAWFDRRK